MLSSVPLLLLYDVGRTQAGANAPSHIAVKTTCIAPRGESVIKPGLEM
jgi:hypothetical protein